MKAVYKYLIAIGVLVLIYFGFVAFLNWYIEKEATAPPTGSDAMLAADFNSILNNLGVK